MKKGNAILLLAAAIWGFGYVSQQTGMEVMGPWSFTAVRCTLGGAALIPLAVVGDRRRKAADPGYSGTDNTGKTLLPAFICFIFLCGTIMVQQYGLLYTGVGKAAFITAFYIFLTPVIGLFMKKKVTARIWLAVAIALLGLFLITMASSMMGQGSINAGDMLMFVAAVAYAFYIHAVDRSVACDEIDVVKFSCLQFLMTGIFAFAVAVIVEPGDITWGNCLESWVSIVYAGVISAAGGFTLQMIGQKYTDPNVSSIILSSEAAFSLLGGWLCLGEVLRPVEYIGCGVMAVAIALAVAPERKNL